MAKQPKTRTSQSLRDALFDELDDLRRGSGDPSRAMAVANLAKQIINIAKVELDFHREAAKHAEAGVALSLGSMKLGSPVEPVETNATEPSVRTTAAAAASSPH